MVNGGYLLLSLGLATISALVLFQLAKCCGCWLCVFTNISYITYVLLIYVEYTRKYIISKMKKIRTVKHVNER